MLEIFLCVIFKKRETRVDSKFEQNKKTPSKNKWKAANPKEAIIDQKYIVSYKKIKNSNLRQKQKFKNSHSKL